MEMGIPAGSPVSVATRHSPWDSPAVSNRSISQDFNVAKCLPVHGFERDGRKKRGRKKRGQTELSTRPKCGVLGQFRLSPLFSANFHRQPLVYSVAMVG